MAGVEVLYKLTSAAILGPALFGVFDLTMKLTGYSYLTLEGDSFSEARRKSADRIEPDVYESRYSNLLKEFLKLLD